MDGMEHMRRVAGLMREAGDRDRAELPNVGHHHFVGYDKAEARAHMGDMGMHDHPHMAGQSEGEEKMEHGKKMKGM
jgi:hypothetical protein